MLQTCSIMAARSLLILGAGGLGQDAAEIARMTGEYSHIAFLDDSLVTHRDVLGRISEMEQFAGVFSAAICAIGKNEVRLQLHQKLIELGYRVPALVHPHASVSGSVQLASGCIVRAGAVIGHSVRIDEACLINIRAVVDHGCEIGAGAHIPIGCIIRNEVKVPELSAYIPNQVVE